MSFFSAVKNIFKKWLGESSGSQDSPKNHDLASFDTPKDLIDITTIDGINGSVTDKAIMAVHGVILDALKKNNINWIPRGREFSGGTTRTSLISIPTWNKHNFTYSFTIMNEKNREKMVIKVKLSPTTLKYWLRDTNADKSFRNKKCKKYCLRISCFLKEKVYPTMNRNTANQ